MKIDLAKYRDKRVCVAVSGGRDSMALLYYLYTHASECGIVLSALNCDHKIRGETSARDSEFVKKQCALYGIPLLFYERDASSGSAVTEETARFWRLGCYGKALERHLLPNGEVWAGADVVATAHHMNDNAETVLFNLARGSALSGMKGITDLNRIIRPLISCTRGEIDEYIEENKISYVDDETNFTDDYTRNKIRRNVLPELEDAVPGAVKAIYRFSRLAAEDEEYFDKLINERGLIKNIDRGFEILHCGEKVVFRRAVVKAITARGIKDYTSEHVQRLYDLQFSENGKKFEFLGFISLKETGKITICEKTLTDNSDEVPFLQFVAKNSGIFGGQPLGTVKNAPSDCPQNRIILKFDFDKIPQTAVIRFMKAGDKFTKFGGGTKSLGDYFTDKKIPQRLRRQIPLIAVGTDIYAVCGVEISEKIKITSETETVSYIIAKDYLKE